jgi:hypothetical protein
MKPIILLLQFVLLLLLFPGCSKDNSELHVQTKGLLKKVENDKGEIVASYTYNKNGTLKTSSEYSIYYLPGKNADFTYTYNSEKQLTSRNGFEPGNQIMSSFTGAMDKQVACVYTYDEEKCIQSISTTYHFEEFEEIDYSLTVSYFYPDEFTIQARQVYEHDTSNQMVSFSAYHFNADGNIDEILMYNDLESTEKPYQCDQFTYDSHPVPYNPLPGPKSANNVLSHKTTAYQYDENGNQHVSYVTEILFEYTYNRERYPASVKEIWPNGQVKTSYLSYYTP